MSIYALDAGGPRILTRGPVYGTNVGQRTSDKLTHTCSTEFK
jgi:hypothetical protein